MNYPYATERGAKRASKFPLLVTRKQRDARRKTRQLEPKGTAERIAMRRALSCCVRVDGRHQRHGLLNRAAFADEVAFCIGSPVPKLEELDTALAKGVNGIDLQAAALSKAVDKSKLN